MSIYLDIFLWSQIGMRTNDKQGRCFQLQKRIFYSLPGTRETKILFLLAQSIHCKQRRCEEDSNSSTKAYCLDMVGICKGSYPILPLPKGEEEGWASLNSPKNNVKFWAFNQQWRQSNFTQDKFHAFTADYSRRHLTRVLEVSYFSKI